MPQAVSGLDAVIQKQKPGENMNKLSITALILTLAFTGAIAATPTTQQPAQAKPAQVTAATTPAQLAALETAAGKKKTKHHRRHMAAPVDRQDTVPYSEMRIGDPRIVYHEIGTSGAQKGNTIIPFYDEPIRSSKPYEIRYDYAEFGRN